MVATILKHDKEPSTDTGEMTAGGKKRGRALSNRHKSLQKIVERNVGEGSRLANLKDDVPLEKSKLSLEEELLVEHSLRALAQRREDAAKAKLEKVSTMIADLNACFTAAEEKRMLAPADANAQLERELLRIEGSLEGKDTMKMGEEIEQLKKLVCSLLDLIGKVRKAEAESSRAKWDSDKPLKKAKEKEGVNDDILMQNEEAKEGRRSTMATLVNGCERSASIYGQLQELATAMGEFQNVFQMHAPQNSEFGCS